MAASAAEDQNQSRRRLPDRLNLALRACLTLITIVKDQAPSCGSGQTNRHQVRATGNERSAPFVFQSTISTSRVVRRSLLLVHDLIDRKGALHRFGFARLVSASSLVNALQPYFHSSAGPPGIERRK